MIKLEKKFEGHYKAYSAMNVYVGDVDREVDGYYAWWPVWQSGCLGEGFLEDMLNTLRALNLEWDKTVREELGKDAEATVEEGN